MWELDREESWEPKNWCFWTVVLEKTLESPLDCKEIQPVHSKGNQSRVFFGRNDAEAKTPILWPSHGKSWLIGKVSDAGRDWGQKKKMTEDEMAGCHHWLDGPESEWTPGDGDGQGGLACCDSWGHKESNRTERLNWTELTKLWTSTHSSSLMECPPLSSCLMSFHFSYLNKVALGPLKNECLVICIVNFTTRMWTTKDQGRYLVLDHGIQ